MRAPSMTTSSLPFPPMLLALDVIGALLFGLGAAEYFGNAALLSVWTGHADAPLIAMVSGAAVMLFAGVGIFRAMLADARSRASGRP